MCVESDGRRTFFHQRGANSQFSVGHVDLTASRARIFLLGYLLLLDALDRLDDDGRTGASRVLERARELAATICECAPIGLRATKIAALKYIEQGEQAAVACIPQIKEQVFASEDFKEGVAAFLAKRPANFTGN